ncbi:MAG: GNAT family N-acetyltransferase, partial [Planctomycetota bacterium]
DTLQIGYGLLPNSILRHLEEKKDLGIHTELLTPGIVRLLKKGVINNSRKTIHQGKTIATFCIGDKQTYDYIHDNLAIEFKPADYTNNPIIISQNQNMVAINTALEIDLTGQATAESLGKMFYSGIGGQADFMRGASLSKGGRNILVLPSTAREGRTSRIVPLLKEGAGVTLNRGDVQYVVTEYGIAYLHGKNIRDRALALVGLAHPKFRSYLLEEAKKLHYIPSRQKMILGREGEYPEGLEAYKTTDSGLSIFIRPVKISDAPLVRQFFHQLSDQTIYRRFMAVRKGWTEEVIEKFVVLDYTKSMVLLAFPEEPPHEEILGMAQYYIHPGTYTGEVALVVKDAYHRKGIGRALLSYLTYIAKQQGLLGFYAEVLTENRPMLNLLEKTGFQIEKKVVSGNYELRIWFQ